MSNSSIFKQILNIIKESDLKDKKKKKVKDSKKENELKGYQTESLSKFILSEINQDFPDKVFIEKPVIERKVQKKNFFKIKQRKKPKEKIVKPIDKQKLLKSSTLKLQKRTFTYLTKDYVMIEEYFVIPPFAKVQILYNRREGKYEYCVIEPPLNEKEMLVLNKLEEILVDHLETTFFDFNHPKEAEEFIIKKLEDIIRTQKWFIKGLKVVFASQTLDKIKYYLVRDLVYLGKIEPLMRDPFIEDISMDGVNIPVFVYHRKYGSMPTNIVFTTLEEANSFAIKLAQRCRRHISLAEPRLDGRLPDGSRVQATYGKEITLKGPTFTIRKFRDQPFTPAHLIYFGTFSLDLMAYIWFVIEHQRTLLIAGGTASGKTTALNAICLFIPSTSKIVSIEDTPEIRIPHENWIQGVSRQGIKIGQYTYGEVTMEDLLKDALRQRPDYIIVGEIRSKEANVLFQAVATGHAGMGTMHADSIEAVVHRLLIRPIELPPSLLEHLDCILIQSRIKHGKTLIRRVIQVAEIKGIDIEKEYPIYDLVFKWNAKEDKIEMLNESYLLYHKLAENFGYDKKDIDEELDKRKYFLNYLVKKRVFDYKEFHTWVTKYYNDKEEVLKKIGYYERRKKAIV